MGSDDSTQTRLSHMIGKSCKYQQIWLFCGQGQRLQCKELSIKIAHKNSKFSLHHQDLFILSTFRSPQIKTNQTLFYKVNLAMFGLHTLDCCHFETKQTSEDALQSEKTELIVSIIHLLPKEEKDPSFSRYGIFLVNIGFF